MHILPNHDEKGHQIIKFGQLIEYNKKSDFIQESCRKWGRGTSCWILFGKEL